MTRKRDHFEPIAKGRWQSVAEPNLLLSVRFWPNPAGQASISGCQVENPATALTGRFRPKAALRQKSLVEA